MAITISLPPETEEKPRKRAADSGQTADGYVRLLVERDVDGVNGGPPAPAPLASLPSDEALAPFRREVAESGMSDEDLRGFFEDVGEEVYREKHARPGDAP